MSMALSKFYEELLHHDWYYEMSDDGSVYRKGQEQHNILLEVAKSKGGEYQRMFDDFQKHFFTGQPWGTKKAPRPELENYKGE